MKPDADYQFTPLDQVAEDARVWDHLMVENAAIPGLGAYRFLAQVDRESWHECPAIDLRQA